MGECNIPYWASNFSILHPFKTSVYFILVNQNLYLFIYFGTFGTFATFFLGFCCIRLVTTFFQTFMQALPILSKVL